MKTTSYKDAMTFAYVVCAVSTYCMGASFATSFNTTTGNFAGLLFLIPLALALAVPAQTAAAADNTKQTLDNTETPEPIETPEEIQENDKSRQIIDDIA